MLASIPAAQPELVVLTVLAIVALAAIGTAITVRTLGDRPKHSGFSPAPIAATGFDAELEALVAQGPTSSDVAAPPAKSRS